MNLRMKTPLETGWGELPVIRIALNLP
jgi:hypothetical protein